MQKHKAHTTTKKSAPKNNLKEEWMDLDIFAKNNDLGDSVYSDWTDNWSDNCCCCVGGFSK